MIFEYQALDRKGDTVSDVVDAPSEQAARQKAAGDLVRPNASLDEIDRARIALLKSLARLQVANRMRTRG